MSHKRRNRRVVHHLVVNVHQKGVVMLGPKLVGHRGEGVGVEVAHVPVLVFTSCDRRRDGVVAGQVAVGSVYGLVHGGGREGGLGGVGEGSAERCAAARLRVGRVVQVDVEVGAGSLHREE